MRRFLLSLVALVVTAVCFAQDIIVQKDGSTIQAKVVKVTQSEVEYKKYNNQNGPTYTIATKDLQCINYENGTKDTFVASNYNSGIVTNETATHFSNDQKLISLFNKDNKSDKHLKKSRILKNVGWITGGTFIAAGLVFMCFKPIDGGRSGGTSDPLVGKILCGSGVVIGGTLLITSYALEKKYGGLYALSIYNHQFNVTPNSNLMVGVDMLNDNIRNNQTLGLGLRYNF